MRSGHPGFEWTGGSISLVDLSLVLPLPMSLDLIINTSACTSTRSGSLSDRDATQPSRRPTIAFPSEKIAAEARRHLSVCIGKVVIRIVTVVKLVEAVVVVIVVSLKSCLSPGSTDSQTCRVEREHSEPASTDCTDCDCLRPGPSMAACPRRPASSWHRAMQRSNQGSACPQSRLGGVGSGVASSQSPATKTRTARADCFLAF